MMPRRAGLCLTVGVDVTANDGFVSLRKEIECTTP